MSGISRPLHPDVSKEADAETRFKEVGEAYEVLKDSEKRATYDQLGSNWKAGQDFRPPPDWKAGFEFSGGGDSGGRATDFSDFFESLYGQEFRSARGGRGPQHAKGDDHHARILIDLEDAYTGAARTISLRAPSVDAQGHVLMREHKLNVTIPRGIRAGQHIRLAGQGMPGLGQGQPGDLYLEVAFNPHRQYRVEQHDVYLDLPVTPWEAALGAAVKVPTPGGIVELKIPPGSGTGSKLRLKGRGIPGKSPGDFYVVLQIILPPADNDTARTVYGDMAKQFPSFNPRAKLGV